jgi:uncharacterized protein
VSEDVTTLRNRAGRVAALVRNEFVPDSPAHDCSHLARVASLGARICATEGGNKLVVLCAAWLHDLHRDSRAAHGRFFVAPEETDERATDFLRRAEIPETFHPEILEAIHYTDRFSFSDRNIQSSAIEARALRDADSLDAIGAVGIARAFSFGGAHGIPLWVEDAHPGTGIYIQSNRPASTIHHFHEKLLRLSGELETAAAKEIARQRSRYLSGFVTQFMQEWHDDLSSGGV